MRSAYKSKANQNLYNGFTLLELSIVLVIIGLIVGGVTVGAEMIRSAKIQSLTKDVDRWKTAVHVYKMKGADT